MKDVSSMDFIMLLFRHLPPSSFPQAWSEVCKTRVTVFDKTGCEKKFLARVVSDQFRCATIVLLLGCKVSHDFAAVFSSHFFIACAIRCCGVAFTCISPNLRCVLFDGARQSFIVLNVILGGFADRNFLPSWWKCEGGVFGNANEQGQSLTLMINFAAFMST